MPTLFANSDANLATEVLTAISSGDLEALRVLTSDLGALSRLDEHMSIDVRIDTWIAAANLMHQADISEYLQSLLSRYKKETRLDRAITQLIKISREDWRKQAEVDSAYDSIQVPNL